MKVQLSTFDRPVFKEQAKGALGRFYGKGIGLTLLCSVIMLPLSLIAELVPSEDSVLSYTEPVKAVRNMLIAWIEQSLGVDSNNAMLILYLGVLAIILIAGFFLAPMDVGIARFYLEGRERSKAKISTFWKGTFKKYFRSLITLFIRNFLITLGSLLLVFPGTILSYRYYFVPYILAENPNVGVIGALRTSARMTDGYKWELFKLDLSFIGWNLLSQLLCGLGDFFLSPYISATTCEAYSFIKQNMLKYNSLDKADYPGFADSEDEYEYGAVYFHEAPSAAQARAMIRQRSNAGEYNAVSAADIERHNAAQSTEDVAEAVVTPAEEEEEEYTPILIMPDEPAEAESAPEAAETAEAEEVVVETAEVTVETTETEEASENEE